jgi:hypothetical protein
MKRWHQEIAHYRKQRATDKLYVKRENELGRYRKRHALDCGNPHCGCCHSDKYPKRGLTDQEVRANISYQEQVKEYSERDRKGTA